MKSPVHGNAVAVTAALAFSVSLGLAPHAVASTSTPSPSASPSSPSSPSGSTPFGPGCSALRGRGQMAKQQVATAAANNPNVAMFVSAVKKANLTAVLNNAKNVTVFAPSNAAFDRLGRAKANALLNNRAELIKVLKYHVVDKTITPAQLPNGSFTTLEGGTLTTSGSGTSFKVNGTAPITCGNITTANAKLYIINGLLTPPS